jgi:hypothetical protein
MNKQEIRKMIREELLRETSKKSKLNEGLLEKLLMAFLSPMIKREVKKIKNDPEIKAAEESVKLAIDQWKMSLNNKVAVNKKELQRLKDQEKEIESWNRNK